MVESSINFELADSSRFEMLERVFVALRDAKKDDAIDADDESWRSYFDDDALSRFWNPTPEELADWTRRWQATPVRNDSQIRRWRHRGTFHQCSNHSIMENTFYCV